MGGNKCTIIAGYRGSKKNATLKEFIPMTNKIKKSNSKINRKNNFGRTTRVATNLRSHFIPLVFNNQGGSNKNQDQGRSRRKHVSAHDRHSICSNTWSNSEAICKFRAQSAQFNTGNKSFRERSRPSASLLISAIQKESQTTQSRNNCSQLVTSAYQIALHEQLAQYQISQQIDFFCANPHMEKLLEKSLPVASK